MKKILTCVCTTIECLLFLWLVVGLWACANKIRELEEQQLDSKIFTGVESDSSKIMACAIRITRLEEENKILINKLNEMDTALFFATNEPVVETKPVVIEGAVDDLIQ